MTDHNPKADKHIWDQMPGLVWSTPNASDDVYIAAALLNPRFLQLLAIAEHFGTERLQGAWGKLKREAPEESRRAAPHVERMIKNILEGERLAHA